jgi:hypothetical protein
MTHFWRLFAFCSALVVLPVFAEVALRRIPHEAIATAMAWGVVLAFGGLVLSILRSMK